MRSVVLQKYLSFKHDKNIINNLSFRSTCIWVIIISTILSIVFVTIMLAENGECDG